MFVITIDFWNTDDGLINIGGCGSPVDGCGGWRPNDPVEYDFLTRDHDNDVVV